MPEGLRRIIKKISRSRARRPKKLSPKNHHYLQNKELARKTITARVTYWSEVSNISYGKITIRNQKRRWGSCSSLGNLNFNYKLSLLPICLLDYVVVHELCHIRELNHGPRFWALVAVHYPSYQTIESELRALERETRLQPVAITAYVQAHSCVLCAPARQLEV